MKRQPFAFPALMLLAHLSFAQNNSSFTAHEWGTFTTLQASNGERLSGLQRDEERLPYFVNNICFCWDDPYEKGYGNLYADISHVTVKMETPVIYFYSDVARDVSVDVQFKQGSISQWYPMRSDGENPIHVDLYGFATPNYIDFSEPRTGWIKWNATILDPDDTSKISSDPTYETMQWVRPRATAANLIKVGYPVNNGFPQIEKFLFYRGIANFEVPVKVEFNDAGKLVITNNFPKSLSYVMVYERKTGQQANILWSGPMGSKNVKVVSQLDYLENETGVENEMKHFENALVDAGLYRDEAAAMLNTWKESYFEHKGLKVFWIAPRSFTDTVLPISINPQPEHLERVIVGRSEVLTPEFEEELMQTDESDFYTKWGSDRFVLAYEQLRAEGIPSQWTSVNKDNITGNTSGINSIHIFPNPAKDILQLSGNFYLSESISIRVISSNGSEVYSSKESAKVGSYINTINVSGFSNGIYLLLFQSGQNNHTLKFIKAE